METLPNIYINPARQNQFILVSIFNNAPIRRKPIAMNSNSAFTGLFGEKPFWYHQSIPRDVRILVGGQPIVHHDTRNKCRLYVTTMKASNFQDDFPLILIDHFKDHYVLVFDLILMQDATEQCHYPAPVAEPLRLELHFSSPLVNVTEVILIAEHISSLGVDKFCVVGKNL